MSGATDFTLHYWPVLARGYLPAIIASVGGLSFAWDKGVQWPAFKPETPFGQLPCLSTKDGKVGQSLAIVRVLARKANLQGETDAEFAMSEQLIQEGEDLFLAIAKAHYAADRTAAMDEFFSKTIKGHLDNLAKLLNGETFTGKTLAGDLAIFAIFDILHRIQPDFLDGHATLKAFYAKIGSCDKVKSASEGLGSYFKRHSD